MKEETPATSRTAGQSRVRGWPGPLTGRGHSTPQDQSGVGPDALAAGSRVRRRPAVRQSASPARPRYLSASGQRVHEGKHCQPPCEGPGRPNSRKPRRRPRPIGLRRPPRARSPARSRRRRRSLQTRRTNPGGRKARKATAAGSRERGMEVRRGSRGRAYRWRHVVAQAKCVSVVPGARTGSHRQLAGSAEAGPRSLVSAKPTDALARVTATWICGSDLHAYHSMSSFGGPVAGADGARVQRLVGDRLRGATVAKGDLVGALGAHPGVSMADGAAGPRPSRDSLSSR